MKKEFIFLLLLLLFLPLVHAQSEVLATSYWGYVVEDGIPWINVSITVLDSAGNEIAHARSNQDGLYQVTVPWDDPATQVDEGVAANENISFRAGGKIATSRVIGPKGSNNRLDLNVISAQAGTPSGSKGNGLEQAITSTPAVTPTMTVTPASTPVQTTNATAAASPTLLTATATRTQPRNTPAPGVVASIVILVYLALARKN